MTSCFSWANPADEWTVRGLAGDGNHFAWYAGFLIDKLEPKPREGRRDIIKIEILKTVDVRLTDWRW